MINFCILRTFWFLLIIVTPDFHFSCSWSFKPFTSCLWGPEFCSWPSQDEMLRLFQTCGCRLVCFLFSFEQFSWMKKRLQLSFLLFSRRGFIFTAYPFFPYHVVQLNIFILSDSEYSNAEDWFFLCIMDALRTVTAEPVTVPAHCYLSKTFHFGKLSTSLPLGSCRECNERREVKWGLKIL